MDWNDVAKIVGQFAWSHRGGLGELISMIRRKLPGASGDEPLVTPSRLLKNPVWADSGERTG